MLFWVMVAFALERASLKLTGWNYDSRFNGYGAIDNIANRTALAPMAYRLLVPLIVRGIERAAPGLRKHRLPALYEPITIGLMTITLIALDRAIGRTPTLLVAALLPVTFHFTYWDWLGELMGIATALWGAASGQVEIAVVGAIVHALSKPETAFLSLLSYGLVRLDGTVTIGLALIVTLSLTRIWVGERQMYCKRVMWHENLHDLRTLFTNRPFYLSEIAMSLGISLLTVGVVAARLLSGSPLPAWPVPLAFVAAGWTMARAAETRVFAPCLIWLAMGLA